mgnify:CR=1 FL=1
MQQALIYPAFLALAGATLITIFITFCGAATDRIHVAKWRCASLPTRILLRRPSFDHRLLVVVRAARGRRGYRLPRVCCARTKDESSWDRFSAAHPGLRPDHSASLLRTIFPTLGTLMENGIPLLRALDLVTEIAANSYLESKLREVRRAVIDGATLSAAPSAQHLFPIYLPT